MRRILIDDNAESGADRSCGLPWMSDGCCFDFRSPDELLLSGEIGSIRGSRDVATLVICCPLKDHSFIGGMDSLEYLYIYDGSGIADISFVKGLVNLKQLLIEGTEISDLSPVCELVNAKNRCAAEADKEQRPPWSYGMQGICISSVHELSADMIDSGELSLGEVIINGVSAERTRKQQKLERMRTARERMRRRGERK